MKVCLSQDLRRTLERHGESGFPEEVCGFLVGKMKGEDKTVTAVWPASNAWEQAGTALAGASTAFLEQEKERRFLIPPEEWLAADTRARAEGMDVLGCYHTHPDHPARPSAHDLEAARGTFPGYSYIILSVRNNKAAEMTSWVLRDDYSQFDEETITQTE